VYLAPKEKGLSLGQTKTKEEGKFKTCPLQLAGIMPKELKLILKQQPIGREETPWLEPQREKFARAAKEAAQELKDSRLKGAAKVRSFNARMSQKLGGGD